MNVVDSTRSHVAGSIVLPITIIRVHRTRSRDHFWSARLCRARCSALRRSSWLPGQIWPGRLRSLIETLATRYCTYLGMARPKAQPHPSKWLHGSTNESVMRSSCRGLQAGAPGGRQKGGKDPFLGCPLKFTLRRSRGAIGRYQGTSGAAVASLGVPRRRGRLRRRGSGAGKGLRKNTVKSLEHHKKTGGG